MINQDIIDFIIQKRHFLSLPKNSSILTPNSKQLLQLMQQFSLDQLEGSVKSSLLYPLQIREPVVVNGFKVPNTEGTLGYCKEMESYFDSTLFGTTHPKYGNIHMRGALIYSGQTLLGVWKYTNADTLISLEHVIDENGKTLLVPGGVYNPFFDKKKK